MNANTMFSGSAQTSLAHYTEGCRKVNITSMGRKKLYETLADPNLQAKDCAAATDDSADSCETSLSELFAGRPDSPAILMTSRGVSDSELADHFGGIAGRLDNAYAQNLFTEREYKELNESLSEYIENITSRNERSIATREIMKEEWNDRSSAGTYSDGRSFEERAADRNARIESYLKENSIDRIALQKMIDDVRGGVTPLASRE